MQRYPEIDLLRGLAILLMVVYHAAYDLQHFYSWDVDVHEGWWLLLARITASLFLFLSGVSAAVSHARGHSLRKTLRRAGVVLAAALLVSAVTFAVDPATFVQFGILHLIGTSLLLLALLSPLKEWTIVFGVLLLFLSDSIRDALPASALFLPLGSPSPSFRSVDYYPLLPWFSVMLLGFGLGRALYARNTAWRNWRPFSSLNTQRSTFNALTFPGRHSLLLYLVHQPIMLGILWIVM